MKGPDEAAAGTPAAASGGLSGDCEFAAPLLDPAEADGTALGVVVHGVEG